MAQVVETLGSALGAVIAPFWSFSLKIVDSIFGKPDLPSGPGRDLKDRTATITDSEAPHVYVYGRARVGSAIVAALTSGARDQYKHIVCVHAAHECDDIEEVYINGRACGTLDVNGFVTSGDYFPTKTASIPASYLGSAPQFTGTGTTLDHSPIPDTLRIFYWDETLVDGAGFEIYQGSYTLVGDTISGLPSDLYKVHYDYYVSSPYVRVLKHLGAVNQVADATMIAELPTKWDASKTLSGMCYTIIRLDLNYQDFQSGCPTVEVLIKGKKLHDVRAVNYPDDTPAWSENNALVIADYLTSELCGVPWTDLPLADFIAAANVCDENIITPVNIGSRYTCNGAVSSDDNQAEVLEKLAQSMAGTITATTWGVTAGKYIAPVMTLSQSDIVGNLSFNSGVSESDLFNGVKGQYINAANLYVPTDFGPYENIVYTAIDGQELWKDIDFLFTNTKQRVHNLARIYTEDQRNGFTIDAEFSYKTWALKVGDRVALTSSFLGQTSKIYRVMSKSYGGDTPIKLTLKEDAETIWDFEDAVLEDQTLNTELPDPFVVQAPSNLAVTEELYETSGSAGVKTKAIVTWNNTISGIIEYELAYRSAYDSYYNSTIRTISEYTEILDIADGRYDFKVRARNHLNFWSDYSEPVSVEIFGLNIIPSDVTGFTVRPFNGMALCNWDRTTDLDVKIGGDVIIRFCPLTTGATFVQSVILPDGEFNGDASNAMVSLATGTYYIQFKDSTDHYSANPASFVATESLISGWTTVQTSTQHTAYTGVKTGCIATDSILKLDSATLFDSLVLIDDVGYIDSIGGLVASGTYEFDSVMDLSTVLTRRFHAHIKSLAYNAADLIDDRLDLIDLWADFDGAIINDVTATTYASISDDNVTYSEWVPFMVSDFNCQYAKFKLILSSNDPTHNINIQELSVSAKVPS